MRILSARIAHAQRVAGTDRVEAMVHILAEPAPGAVHDRAQIAVSAPAHAPDGACLRQRLIAAAKLAYAAGPRPRAARRAA
jgi:hypothetical protein